MEDIRVRGILQLLGIHEPHRGEGTQPNTFLKDVIRNSGRQYLLGAGDAVIESEISQWLSLSQQIGSLGSDVALKNSCQRVDSFLKGRSFLVGQQLTVADAAVFQSIAESPHLKESLLNEFTDLLRWMSHVSLVCVGRRFNEAPIAPTVFPIGGRMSHAIVESTKTTPAPQDAKVSGAAKDSNQSIKVDSSDKVAKKSAKPEAAAPTSTAAAAIDTELDPSKLDIRVGLVTKCWEHPDSEKLYCEEIDIGEETVRSIASGLRQFYASSNDIANRKVLVLANLKERPLGGFKSQGMVLCASNDDHTAVQLVDPPASSKPGDRVVFAGFESGEPANPSQMAKKKIFEKLAPQVCF